MAGQFPVVQLEARRAGRSRSKTRRFEAGRGSVDDNEKTPQASAETRKTWLENDIENHELKLDHLDEEIVQVDSRLKDLRRQRANLVSHLNEARHKLDDVTRLVDLEMQNQVLRREVESLRNGKIL